MESGAATKLTVVKYQDNRSFKVTVNPVNSRPKSLLQNDRFLDQNDRYHRICGVITKMTDIFKITLNPHHKLLFSTKMTVKFMAKMIVI